MQKIIIALILAISLSLWMLAPDDTIINRPVSNSYDATIYIERTNVDWAQVTPTWVLVNE
jgi:hypothetical protein